MTPSTSRGPLHCPDDFGGHPNPGIATSQLHGFLLAFQEPGAPPVVRRNPIPPAHPSWAEAARRLSAIDGGSADAVAARLDHADFHARFDACLDRHGVVRRFPSGHGEPAPGCARRMAGLEPRSDELYEALDPGDRWPGAPDGPLGRIGYWYGTAARHVFLGEDNTVIDDAVRAIIAQLKAHGPWRRGR